MKIVLCLAIAVGLSLVFSKVFDAPNWVDFFVGFVLGSAAWIVGRAWKG